MFGHFGELHPRALEALKADGPIVGFEVILDRIPEPKAKPTRAKPVLELSAFQPVSRDFAFVVDSKVKAGDLVRAAQNVDKKLITGVTVFDVYEGKGIEPGKKSIAIAVTIQPREKTMTDEEIDALGGKIVAEVTKRTGGVLARPDQAGSRSVYAKPSRTTVSPTATGIARSNIGPAVTKEWNSPFSPQGSTSPGKSESNAASYRRPQKDCGSFARSTVARCAPCRHRSSRAPACRSAAARAETPPTSRPPTAARRDRRGYLRDRDRRKSHG